MEYRNMEYDNRKKITKKITVKVKNVIQSIIKLLGFLK